MQVVLLEQGKSTRAKQVLGFVRSRRLFEGLTSLVHEVAARQSARDRCARPENRGIGFTLPMFVVDWAAHGKSLLREAPVRPLG